MDYIKARTYIDESHRFGGEMGLEAITCLLEKLGNPQDDLQFLHIAGTNGKGSVGAYLAAVLQEAGTGLADLSLRHCMNPGTDPDQRRIYHRRSIWPSDGSGSESNRGTESGTEASAVSV